MVGSRAMTQDLARFVEAHALQPVIDRTFDFARAADAFTYLAGGRHFGKVVIVLR
jgi:NADPH:quinone reductase-like Zn-dependent oxidoreductase